MGDRQRPERRYRKWSRKRINGRWKEDQTELHNVTPCTAQIATFQRIPNLDL